MSSPPIVQLSQVLYLDVPSTAPTCSPSHRSARNGIHDGCVRTAVAASPGTTEMMERPARAVRLLLPRTFAVADRAYHDSVAAEKKGKARERRSGDVGRECCRGDSTPEGPQQSGSAWEEHDGSSTGSGSTSTTTCPIPQNDTGASQERPRCSIRPAAMATKEGGLVIVVESVLGLTAVQALLDQSYAAVRSAVVCKRDATAVDDNACAASVAPTGVDVNRAVGRLAGWLRIAAMSTALQRQGYADDRSSGVVKVAGGKHLASMLDPYFDDDEFLSAVAAVATADGRTDNALYEVTGRCEAGEEWVSFDVGPTTTGAQGRTSKGEDSQHTAAVEILEVRLICHPLVTMAPDIRWCLRLIGQAKAFAALLNANAKLSTLGGGYFLTRQVGQAIRLALAQSEVATALGDLQLAGKCRVNVAYNYIWLGQYVEAERIIDAQVAASRAIHDEELENVASIAGRFLRRSRKANHRLLRSQLDTAGGADRGCDERARRGDGKEWVPPKIDVKTDEWHRVRAIPMYCSSGRPTPLGVGGEASRARKALL